MSKYDGLILPQLPLEKQSDKFTLDTHAFLQNLLRMLKTTPDGGFPIYHNKFGLADDETWDSIRRGIYIISADNGASYAIANCLYNSAVTLLDDSGNWVTTDTDSKYCLIDSTTYIRLKNRIGSAKEFSIMIITVD